MSHISNFDLITNRRLKKEILSIDDYIGYRVCYKLPIIDSIIKREDLSFDIIDKNKIEFILFFKDKYVLSLIFK